MVREVEDTSTLIQCDCLPSAAGCAAAAGGDLCQHWPHRIRISSSGRI